MLCCFSRGFRQEGAKIFENNCPPQPCRRYSFRGVCLCLYLSLSLSVSLSLLSLLSLFSFSISLSFSLCMCVYVCMPRLSLPSLMESLKSGLYQRAPDIWKGHPSHKCWGHWNRIMVCPFILVFAYSCVCVCVCMRACMVGKVDLCQTYSVSVKVEHKTNKVNFRAKETPKACRNFLQLSMDGYYDKIIFHRIVKDFMAQTGDPTGTGKGKPLLFLFRWNSSASGCEILISTKYVAFFDDLPILQPALQAEKVFMVGNLRTNFTPESDFLIEVCLRIWPTSCSVTVVLAMKIFAIISFRARCLCFQRTRHKRVPIFHHVWQMWMVGPTTHNLWQGFKPTPFISFILHGIYS